MKILQTSQVFSAVRRNRLLPYMNAFSYFIQLTFRGLALIMAISTSMSIAASANSKQPSSCSKFRNGPTVQEQIAIFSKRPVEDPKAYQLKTITFRQEYIFGILSPPDTDGLPSHGRTFGINIDDGQPLSEETQRGSKLFQVREVTIDIEGRSSQSLTLSLKAYADVPFTPDENVGGKYSPTEPVLAYTNSFLFDYEHVKVERGKSKDVDFYAKRDASGTVIGTLICDLPGSVPFPGCTLALRDENFFIETNGRRTTFESDLPKIEKLAQDFTACLLSDGK